MSLDVGARPPHPDDCRAALRALGERRQALQRELQEWSSKLGDAAAIAVSAGLSIVEIAALTGVSRPKVYAATDIAAVRAASKAPKES